MKCDICGGPGPKTDALAESVIVLCKPCMNEHLAEKARRRRVPRPEAVDLRALAGAVRSASLVPAKAAVASGIKTRSVHGPR